LTGLPWWGLAVLGLAVVTLLSVWLWRTRTRLSGAAIGLIIGGALGNIADRIRWGAVTDFLDFHVGQYHWPAFNVADVAIVSGVGLLLLKWPKLQAS
jgi:signal peptidase II